VTVMVNRSSEQVHAHLCSGCGVCAGLCPERALEMDTLTNGDLAAVVTQQCESNCGMCRTVCPFTEGLFNPRPLNERLFGSADAGMQFDDNIGWHLRNVVGCSQIEGQRASSASGGLTTWCLESLLKREMVDRVAVVRLAADRRKNLFEFRTSGNVEKVRSSSGSIYHPVEISDVVRQIAAESDTRWALVGVPCMCAAVRQAPQLKEQIRFVLGLACGMYQNTMYTEVLLSKAGVKRDAVAEITYRGKSERGPASNFLFVATDRGGRKGRPVPYRGLPSFLGLNGYFRLDACNYCMDVFAETADACFMDAWLPGNAGDPRGTSLVVIRDGEIDDLIREGAASGELAIEEIAADQVVRSQGGHVRRKRELIAMRLGAKADRSRVTVSPTRRERLDWWLQQRTQPRSKRAWRRYGRRWGRWAFWLVMGHLLVIQVVRRLRPGFCSLPRRAVGKILRLLGLRHK